MGLMGLGTTEERGVFAIMLGKHLGNLGHMHILVHAIILTCPSVSPNSHSGSLMTPSPQSLAGNCAQNPGAMLKPRILTQEPQI